MVTCHKWKCHKKFREIPFAWEKIPSNILLHFLEIQSQNNLSYLKVVIWLTLIDKGLDVNVLLPTETTIHTKFVNVWRINVEYVLAINPVERGCQTTSRWFSFIDQFSPCAIYNYLVVVFQEKMSIKISLMNSMTVSLRAKPVLRKKGRSIFSAINFPLEIG